jgi:hypothetical protein
VTTIHVVLYGLLAGLSAVAATAVIVVLRTNHGRSNGLAFTIGFVVAQLAVCALALVIGIGTVPQRHRSHHRVEGVLELLLGAGLLVWAWRVRHPRPHLESSRRIRTELHARRDAAMVRLGGMGPGAMVGSGALLCAGPKRLTLTFLAVATIATAGLATTTEVGLVGVYVAIATALVWVPVALTLVFGRRAAEWTAATQEWWETHRMVATFVPLVVLGVYFAAIGVVDLVGA